MDLRETYLSRNLSIRGTAVGFNIDVVRLPNGKQAKREYLDHPGAVAVVAIPKPGHIILVKQFRHPIQEITWEIPAGKLHKGEEPLPCVKRELEEETGYRAKRFKKLLSFWPTAAFANEIIHIYLARQLKAGSMNLDHDEFLQYEIWPLEKALRAVKTGHIKDSKTIIGLLAYELLRL